MVYTEIRKINNKRYYYRVLSYRKNNKVSKKRVYLGTELNKEKLKNREKDADEKLLYKKTNKEIEKVKKKIIPLLKRNKVIRAGIFGSYARGEQKKGSDIDIAIQINDKKMSLLGFIGLIRLLEEALNKKVDLVEYSAIKPIIKESILKEEIKIL